MGSLRGITAPGFTGRIQVLSKVRLSLSCFLIILHAGVDGTSLIRIMTLALWLLLDGVLLASWEGSVRLT